MKKIQLKKFSIKKFQFKSLTMRIWFILSVVILIIIVSISLIQFFAFDRFNESKDRDILQNSHEFVLLDPDHNVINQITEDLGIHHFIYNKSTEKVQLVNERETEADKSLLLWMSSFIKGEPGQDYNKEFTGTFKNNTYMFEISAVHDNQFLISYQSVSKGKEILKLVLIAGLILAIGLYIAKLVARSITKPLEQLETYTKHIAHKEWDSGLELNRQDEIGRLAEAMNEMKHSLQQADEEETKFLQSISHDLKTPVMVIMSYAQAIIDGMYVDSAENTAMIIKNEAIRLEKKIKQILYLNTLDYVLDNENEHEEMYLDKLLAYLVHNFTQVNGDLNWHLDMEVKQAAVVGNPDSIRVSIENILENQLRYAAKTVRVSLKESGQYWVIEIRNDGSLITEKDLNQIFKNLYKGDKGNFGLGLAISQKIIDYYHGEVRVENKDNQVCFTVHYPKKQ